MKKLLVAAVILTLAPACIVVRRGPPHRHPHRHHLALDGSRADAPASSDEASSDLPPSGRDAAAR
jgi:hypothetical protein